MNLFGQSKGRGDRPSRHAGKSPAQRSNRSRLIRRRSMLEVLEGRCLLTVTPQGITLAPTPVEQTPFSGVVATFTSVDVPDPADFSATVLWGDGGSTTNATIVPIGETDAGFQFAVVGNHIYAEETNGQLLQIIVPITDNLDSTTAIALSQTTVADSPLTGTSAAAFSGTEGAPLTGQALATFNHLDGDHDPSDYRVSVDWGDGTAPDPTATLTITPGSQGVPDTIDVTGNHTYDEQGTYNVAVTLTDDSGSTRTVTNTVTIHDAGALTNNAAFTLNATVGSPLNNVLVAAFIDPNPRAKASDFAALVSWNGTTRPGNVVQVAPGVFGVTSSYTFTSPGTALPVVTTVTDVGGRLPAGDTATTFSNIGFVRANVAAAALVPDAGPVAINEGTVIPAGTPVGTFTDLGGAQPVGNYASSFASFPGATANTPLTITQNGTTNTYTLATAADTNFSSDRIEEGSYNYTLKLADTGGNTATSTGLLLVNDAPLSLDSFNTLGVTEGAPVTAQLLSFKDDNTDADPSDFLATIDWGDGTPASIGTINALGDGFFGVTGTHTYAEASASPATVTVHVMDVGGQGLTQAIGATILDAPLSAGTAFDVNGAQGQSLNNVALGTFHDANPLARPSDFDATINWGDSTSGPGSVTLAGGSSTGANFLVSGSHHFANPGVYPVNVTIDDAEGNSTTITTTVTMSAPTSTVTASVLPITATEGQPTPANSLIATFTSSLGSEPIANFSGMIDWGDGTPVEPASAIVADGGGNYHVLAPAHTYAEAGPYVVKVTIVDSAGPNSSTAANVAIVQDANLTADPNQPSVNANQQTPIVGVPVAKFSDANPKAPVSDFSATIDWGDGTPQSVGQVSQPGGIGTPFVVSGSHIFARPAITAGTITVDIRDVDGKTLTTTTRAIVNPSTITGTSSTIAATEGQPIANATVATFSDSAIPGPISDYAAMIDWGTGLPGATTIGQVVPLGGNQFAVVGTFTYPEEDTAPGTPYPITVTIDHNGQPATTIVSHAQVADAALSSRGTIITGIEGNPLAAGPGGNGLLVATVNDSNPLASVGDFKSFTIDWGDGTPVVTVPLGNIKAIGAPNGVTFELFGGPHVYKEEGTYKITVTADDTGGAVTVAGAGAWIADAPPTPTAAQPSVALTEGVSATLPVAIFNDANPGGNVSDFLASIDWGDGTPRSDGLVSQPGGPGTAFMVTGSHNYINPFVNGGTGRFPINVVVRDVGGAATIINNSASITPFPITISGRLDPGTDTGRSNSDAITRDNQPRFLGSTEPYANVRLYATAAGTTNPTLIGQGAADGTGGWAITSNTLPDGSYTIAAVATDRSGIGTAMARVLPNANQGPLVIDTVGPKVTNVVFGPTTGQVLATFQDDRSGMDLATVADAANYSIVRRHRPAGSLLVTALPTTGGPTGSVNTSIVINGGQPLRGGVYTLTIRSGGLADVAGNALDGEFYGYFPSGNNVPGGDFIAQLDALHRTVFPARTVIGTASPVKPPGQVPSGYLIPFGTKAGTLRAISESKRQADAPRTVPQVAVHDRALSAVRVPKKGPRVP